VISLVVQAIGGATASEASSKQDSTGARTVCTTTVALHNHTDQLNYREATSCSEGSFSNSVRYLRFALSLAEHQLKQKKKNKKKTIRCDHWVCAARYRIPRAIFPRETSREQGRIREGSFGEETQVDGHRRIVQRHLSLHPVRALLCVCRLFL
jgi:hypothetical protein